MKHQLQLILLAFLVFSCNKNSPEDMPLPSPETDVWQRDTNNPVLRDLIPAENYEVASDSHVFYDEDGNLRMVYTGDYQGRAAIKLANGASINQWSVNKAVVFEENNDGLDLFKETPFYRKSSTGKHQIFYIGYDDETTYQSQIYLAEADRVDGIYTQRKLPVVPRGILAGKDVYLITSPSIVAHQGLLYMVFIGWNNAPDLVSEIWIIGAVSSDDGYTWSDFQLVDTPIGAEGQITKTPDGGFVAVRTAEFDDDEAIFYATANHPFGPWKQDDTPILTKDGSILEKDEIIAAQVTFNPQTQEEYLFYTGANQQIGWWIMLAQRARL